MESSKPYFDQVANQWDMMQKSYYSNSVREKAFAMAHLREGGVAADIGSLKKVPEFIHLGLAKKFLLPSGPRGTRQKNLQNLDSVQLEGKFIVD
jgi:hypothetical protein